MNSGSASDDAEELRHEPALADARYADDGHELRPVLAAHALERRSRAVELLGTPTSGAAETLSTVGADLAGAPPRRRAARTCPSP
jgi:hypothetical protein